MASFLSKFARGAAKQGGVLLADKYQQDVRAELQAKRDAVLEGNRAKSEQSRRVYEGEKTKQSQEFQAGLAKEGQEFQLKRDKLKREADASLPQNQVAKKELANAEQINQLSQRFVNAESEKEKTDILKKLAVLKGSTGMMTEMLRSKGGKGYSQYATMVQTFYKSLALEQSEGYSGKPELTEDELIGKAMKMAEKVFSSTGASPSPGASPGADTDTDEDKNRNVVYRSEVPEGTKLFPHKKDKNKFVAKINGEWVQVVTDPKKAATNTSYMK